MFVWTPDMVRFLKDASEYTAYYEALAQKVAAHLDLRSHVCDAGCGLGYLSLALAKRFSFVSAVDVSPLALSVLQGNANAQHVNNLEIVEGDVFCKAPKTHYDAMIFCFFGRTDEALRIAKLQCHGKAVIIKKNWETHRFDLGGAPIGSHTFSSAVNELTEWGIPYKSETFALEFGQPFATLEDAQLFFQVYAKSGEAQNVSPEEAQKHLVRTADKAYPYYLPSLKKMGMLVVDTGDIPDDIHKKMLGEQE
ncbi:MAG TPA: methyltransferase [Clostridia bacterium]|nr:methyltransferase [Clostridia bacterium]